MTVGHLHILFEKFLFRSSAHFLMLSCMNCLYIWILIPYLSYYLQALFPIQYVVDLSMGSFAIQKLLCLIGSHLFIFAFNSFSLLFDYAKAFDHVDHNKLWKILKEMGIPDHLTCLLRNLHAG